MAWSWLSLNPVCETRHTCCQLNHIVSVYHIFSIKVASYQLEQRLLLSNFELHLFLERAVMLMTSGSLLSFGVFRLWWQCRKQDVCVGHVHSVPWKTLPSYGHAGMVHIWWLDQGDMHDDLKGKAMDMILLWSSSVENHMLCRPSIDCLLETGPMENNMNRQMHK